MCKRLRHTGLLSGLCLVALLSCGQQPQEDEPQLSLDGLVEDTGYDTNSWEFKTDASSQPDALQGDTAASDVAPGDAGPVIVSTCAGKCGLKLESNPCHCDHGCLARGDCCASYDQSCACTQKSDCDDGNDCTTDVCAEATGGAKYCKQIPFFGCCNSDADCGPSGNNPCIKTRCLLGSCGDVAKDCDDGIACTSDSCDPGTGSCEHELPSNKCLIDGACHGAGATKPGSGGCLLCQPDVDAAVWSPKVGTCLIEGICHAAGDKASVSLDECRVCNPTKSTVAWSVASGSCYIDGVCVAGGAKNPKQPDCAVCNPNTPTQWSAAPDKCVIDGVCYAAQDKLDGASCASCAPSKSSSTWFIAPGACLIAGACYSAADVDTTGCGLCDPKLATDAWSPVPKGTPCVDGSPCTIDTVCTASGQCLGKTKPDCCESNADCLGKVPLSTCQEAVCKSNGSCEAQTKPSCCTSGKCCDLSNNTLFPKGTACSTLKLATEYKCEGGVGYKRDTFPGCTGTHPTKCSQTSSAAGQWVVYKTCDGGTQCVMSSPTSAPVCK